MARKNRDTLLAEAAEVGITNADALTNAQIAAALADFHGEPAPLADDTDDELDGLTAPLVDDEGNPVNPPDGDPSEALPITDAGDGVSREGVDVALDQVGELTVDDAGNTFASARDGSEFEFEPGRIVDLDEYDAAPQAGHLAALPQRVYQRLYTVGISRPAFDYLDAEFVSMEAEEQGAFLASLDANDDAALERGIAELVDELMAANLSARSPMIPPGPFDVVPGEIRPPAGGPMAAG